MQKDEHFIVYPKTKEQVDALQAFMQALKIDFERSNYNTDFVKKVKKSKIQQLHNEDRVIETDDLWK